MRTIFFSALLFLFTGPLACQPYFDLAGIQYQLSPDAVLTGKDKNPVTTAYVQATINAPLNVFKNDKIFINPSFEWTMLDFKKSGYADLDLYGASLALSYLKQWKNKKWQTVFVSVNRLSSDFKNLSLKHYQPGGAILMIYERSDRIKYKFGAYYNAEFFGAFVLPLIGLDWKITDRMILHGIVPRNLMLEYKITPSVYAGINWRAITNSYRFRGTRESDYFKVEENQIRLFGDFYLKKHLVFNLEAGHTVFRKLNNRSELQRLSGLDSDLVINDGLTFKAGFYYRFRLDEQK